MIELTEQQRQEIANETPPEVINPQTRERFVLLREDVYEKVKRILSRLNRYWGSGEDDLIRR
jgi:hypothetical protein